MPSDVSSMPPVVFDPNRHAAAKLLHLVMADGPLPDGAATPARLMQFSGEVDQVCAFEGGVLVGLGDGSDRLAAGAAAARLAEGDYKFAPGTDLEPHALAFALGAYRFRRYREGPTPPTLVIDDEALALRVQREAATIALGRDLINTPAEDMGPDQLEEEAARLASQHGAQLSVHKGSGFQDEFPLIHAVGRAAHSEPRLMELTWSGGDAMHFTLVGKGVCFDTGGLNLKPGRP